MNRRSFLSWTTRMIGALAVTMLGRKPTGLAAKKGTSPVTLFLCGDVMTGRGIDQVLHHPSDPVLFESSVRDPRRYVELAEKRYGPIPRPVDSHYIWGKALAELDRRQPAARIINLETAVTQSDDYWQGKGINYRMHPANVDCLTAAKIDCCVLANNHVLDWGYAGLSETIASLVGARIETAGAGGDLEEASAPAILALPDGGRVLVFAFGTRTSGIPALWGAGQGRAGLNMLFDLSEQSIRRIAAQIAAVKQPGDLVVASIHWGPNWRYLIPPRHQRFARGLIDEAGVDVVHGHSSHHPIGIEVYRDKPIFYGCGDFINDYEGIGGHQDYRGDLALAYWVSLDPATGKLVRLEMTPFQSRRFRLESVSPEDAAWLQKTLDRESRALGSRVDQSEDGNLKLSTLQPSR